MMNLRKSQISIEEIWHEGGPRADTPLRVATALAVVDNPLAGKYHPDVLQWMASLHELGDYLAAKVIAAVGGAIFVEAYGKGAIVGEDGELEHGAIWHEAGGLPLRRAMGGCKAIVPAAKTIGAVGARLIVPLGHVRAAFVRSHMNSAELTIWDAPRRNEVVFGLAVATGPRIHSRCGGLRVAEIALNDGQR